MNQGPLIFLGAFASLALSWLGLVLGPQLQFGADKPQKIEEINAMYPAARSGLAQQGAEVYRRLGCNQCHAQQVRQEGLEFGARLTAPGEKLDDVAKALVKMGVATDLAAAKTKLGTLPLTLGERIELRQAEFLVKHITDADGKAEITFKNLGPELDRGWGVRFSAAQDYLFDETVLAGSLRTGPDLANIGVRAPERFAAPWKFTSTNTLAELRAWHFKHLNDPRSVAPGSTMPAYRFLFDTRTTGTVPTRDAEALVAYLMSLRQDVSLPNAPLPRVARAMPAPVATNSPAK